MQSRSISDLELLLRISKLRGRNDHETFRSKELQPPCDLGSIQAMLYEPEMRSTTVPESGWA